ncbi:class I tRNA ligase family protein [archaeon]|jgi:valyl-tRNA synthetase|nr:class I tRNA ligase family protein [archaeon]
MDMTLKYDPKQSETKWQKFWEKNSIFTFNADDVETPIYSIDTPPPTVSGKMHLGHAFSYTQQDFIARYKRLAGFNVYYPFGTDDNGLATIKLVQKHKKVNLRKVSRDDAIKTCLEFLEEERPKFIQDWKNIGMSCDFTKCYSTISDYSRKTCQQSFLDLVKKNLIYRKEGPVVWDRVFQTAIAQAELEDKQRKSKLNYIKAKFQDEENTYAIYATTRPELLYATVGVSIEAAGTYVKIKVKDEFWITGKTTLKDKFKDFDYKIIEEIKGSDLQGRKVQIPISNIIITLGDDESVKADYGTGIVYFCTYGGIECIEWMARNPDVQVIDVLQKDGRLKENCEKYAGMLCEEARRQVQTDLKESNELILQEQVDQVVNIGERSGVEVEIIVSKQWYVKYLDRKEDFLVGSEKLNWHPKHMKHRLDNWVKGLKWDWGFSRQRHFGIPIPVWYDKDGNPYYPDESQLPVDPLKDRPLSAPKDLELTPEIDVFDTWFNSSSTPFLAINLLKGTKAYESGKMFPMSLRPQAHDIINFWLFYTMAKTRLLTNGTNPWKDVTISGFVLDPKGNKMSKSKGNVVAPQDVIEKFSADAIRYWAATSKLGEDLAFQEKDLKTGQKFVNKLWNASKFTFSHLEDYDSKEATDKSVTETFDHWILTKLQIAIRDATEQFDKYEYAKAKASIEKFFWAEFCDQYLEIIKDRLYNAESRGKEARLSAQYAARQSILAVTTMMAPITPHITEEIYQLFFKDTESYQSIHKATWPKVELENIDSSCEEKGDLAIDVINSVRKFKSTNQLSLKTELASITIESKHQEQLSTLLDDLKAVTHAKEIIFAETVAETDSIETENFSIKLVIHQ